jgi:hypothetical protein
MQAKRLINIIHLLASAHASAERGLITPTQELLPGWTIPQWPELRDVPCLKR